LPPAVLRYRPLRLARWAIWGGTALLLLVLPLVFDRSFAISLLSQMGIMIVFALSYNMLLGQSGMLSFGHAVYSGLGAYFAMHLMVLVGAGRVIFPISLLPLVGGLAGLLFGVIFGWLTTKRAGTPFAMITLGIGEMVFAAALMFPAFFGGEAGISGNRTAGGPLFGVAGWTLGPERQVYYLIAAWTLACMAAMYALTHTPLGRIANAVRDNPERAEFIGYDTQRVRWLMLILSSFFAGIAGGLAAIHFEIVGADSLSTVRSGGVLLAAFIGGTAFFFGPILGAVLFILFSVALSEFTPAWQLYLGVFFVLLVMFAPGGLAALALANLRILGCGRFARLRDPYFGALAAALTLAAGAVMLIEMTYHRTLGVARGTTVHLLGLALDVTRAESWVFASAVLLAGGAAFVSMRRRAVRTWDTIRSEIEARARARADD
jgi:branched-chain amino acid transport system permease protein